MPKTPPHSSGWLLLAALALLEPTPASAAGPVVPLDPEIAEDLGVLGPGVVGQPVPAPKITDVEKFLNAGPGEWTYQIVYGEGDEVRRESYEAIRSPDGHKAYKRSIGEMFVEYIQVDADGHFGKYAEDDLDVGYGARMEPGILVHAGVAPGDRIEVKSKLEAFKLGKPNEIEYTGEMTSRLQYVGAYQVTTPAGSWPAVLIRNEFDVEIGPATVKDVAYLFFAEGVGKVAEVESLGVSALLVYNSNTKTAKVLKSLPARAP